MADAGDGATAGPDALDVDHGQAEVVPVPPVPVGLDLGLPVAHQADVEAGAAHVDGDEVTHPDLGAASAAPITPPVGPDARSDTARLATYSGGMTPPVACMISSDPA